MANSKKIVQAAAGSAGGAGLNVEEVFSTYLYDGTGAAQTITNGIDLSGEGGLVWIKCRNAAENHNLYDTERGSPKFLESNTTDAENSGGASGFNGFNSNGFSLATNDSDTNNISNDYASWTFRKAPKFFDVVTYTGTGVARTVSHNLGSVPGMIIIKRTDSTTSWNVYHRGLNGGTNPHQYGMNLNTTGAEFTSSSYWNNTAPTSTEFTVGTGGNANASGGTYVAYLFAHNDGDGDFGPTGDQDVIKCGSYSQSSASDVDVDLGFEPQFVIVKRSDNISQWYVLDEMRGFLAGSNSTSSRTLYANLINAEADFTIQKTATGFTWPSGQYGSGTQQYIYIAIRRGPMAVPTAATDVFSPNYYGDSDPSNEPIYKPGFVTDTGIVGYTPGGSTNYPYLSSRMTGTGRLTTSSTAAEATSSNIEWDFMNGWQSGVPSALNTSFIGWNWKRAPSFFDVVAYTSSVTHPTTMTVSHNLGVVPEMMWKKARQTNSTSNSWRVYHKDLNGGVNPEDKVIVLNSSGGQSTSTDDWGSTAPTSTEFTAGYVESGIDYITYLFASVDGVSKVGSYTGNGTSQTIDCGFTTGARFILIKRTDTNGDWWVLDTKRGIVAGNDALLNLNTTSAEVTSVDVIDPNSSGFTVDTTNGDFNASGGSYIFYAIA